MSSTAKQWGKGPSPGQPRPRKRRRPLTGAVVVDEEPHHGCGVELLRGGQPRPLRPCRNVACVRPVSARARAPDRLHAHCHPGTLHDARAPSCLLDRVVFGAWDPAPAAPDPCATSCATPACPTRPRSLAASSPKRPPRSCAPLLPRWLHARRNVVMARPPSTSPATWSAHRRPVRGGRGVQAGPRRSLPRGSPAMRLFRAARYPRALRPPRRACSFRRGPRSGAFPVPPATAGQPPALRLCPRRVGPPILERVPNADNPADIPAGESNPVPSAVRLAAALPGSAAPCSAGSSC